MKNYILTILILLASLHLFSQDTLSSNTTLEKARYLTEKIAHELTIDSNRKEQVFDLLYARSMELEGYKNLDYKAFVEKINDINTATIERLKEVLDQDQIAVLLKLRKDKKEAKEKFREKYPDYTFTREDEELDF